VISIGYNVIHVNFARLSSIRTIKSFSDCLWLARFTSTPEGF
jgi:hypothetical protein